MAHPHTLYRASLASLCLLALAPAASAQQPAPSYGTTIVRHTDHVTNVGDFPAPSDAPPPPTTPAPTPAHPGEVGGTGSVAVEHGPNGELRGSSGPAPGAIDMTTPIGPADVARLVRAREPDLRPCYDQALAAHPGLAGRMELRFTIGRAGVVTAATASGLPEAPEVATCMADRLRRMPFPPPATGTLPSFYPMTLAPPAPAHPGRGRRGAPPRAPAAHPTR